MIVLTFMKKPLINKILNYMYIKTCPNTACVLYHLGHHFHLFIYLIYFFLAALGLRFFVQAFSSCGEQGLLFVAVRGLLIVVASLVAEHMGSRCAGFSYCGPWAQ